MRVPRGRWVAVQRSVPDLCPICSGSRTVRHLVKARQVSTATAQSCPHCSNADHPMPLVYLPTYQDQPRKDAR